MYFTWLGNRKDPKGSITYATMHSVDLDGYEQICFGTAGKKQ